MGAFTFTHTVFGMHNADLAATEGTCIALMEADPRWDRRAFRSSAWSGLTRRRVFPVQVARGDPGAAQISPVF